jgi:hypothetical protein
MRPDLVGRDRGIGPADPERMMEPSRHLTSLEAPAADPAGTTGVIPPARGDDPEVISYRLEDLPRELGVLLMSVGVLGIVLPGLAGAPAFIAGGLVLWPKSFGGIEDWFHGRFPEAHRSSMKQVGRFLGDLHRRFPETRTSRETGRST